MPMPMPMPEPWSSEGPACRSLWNGTGPTIVRLSLGLGLQMSVLEGLKEGLRWQHMRSADQERGEPGLVRHTISCMTPRSKCMHVMTVHSLPNPSGRPDLSRMSANLLCGCLLCVSTVAHCRLRKHDRVLSRPIPVQAFILRS